MAQPASSPKIEELRFRLKTDPKSRLFFPLAEELRKIDQFGEAEQVLRAGLAQHPTYLSAWVSLGRVLREAKKHQDAVEALMKALTLDPGNVVAARLLADSYLDLGDRLEAIKKYKLVRALLPTDDEELEAMIAKLDQELNAPPHPPAPFMADAEPPPLPETDVVPMSGGDQVFGEAPEGDTTADGEPMLAAHSESPFEEPVKEYNAAAVTIEKPMGIHVDEGQADVANTATMADLYAKQGVPEKAREIYQSILQREPANADVKTKLDSLGASARNPKVDKLEQWLAKVKKREQGSVV